MVSVCQPAVAAACDALSIVLRMYIPATPQITSSASGITIQSTVLRLNPNRRRGVAIVAIVTLLFNTTV